MVWPGEAGMVSGMTWYMVWPGGHGVVCGTA